MRLKHAKNNGSLLLSLSCIVVTTADSYSKAVFLDMHGGFDGIVAHQPTQWTLVCRPRRCHPLAGLCKCNTNYSKPRWPPAGSTAQEHLADPSIVTDPCR